MIKKYKTVIFIFVIIGILFWQNQTILIADEQKAKQNLSVIDSLFQASISEIIDKITSLKDFEKDTINYHITENEADWLVQKHLANKLEKFVLVNNKSSKKNFVGITIENIDLNYNFVANSNDFVIRSATLKLFASVYDKKNHTFTFEIEKYFEDTLNYTQLEFANRSGFAFAKAEIPKKKLSFWNKYLEPTIAVVSAAIVTTLFFTVRSK